MLYRPYTPEDFAQLYAIEEVCFQPPFRFGRRYMRKAVEQRNGATWIAEEAGSIKGFAVIEWTQEIGGVSAYIQTIEVTPQERGQGVGRELLRMLEGSTRGAGAEAIWLHVDASNEAAIRLYESAGYRRQGREEDYYAPGRAALIYKKEFVTGVGGD